MLFFHGQRVLLLLYFSYFDFSFSSGTEFPEDLSEYRLIIHCGGCMLNDREMRYRMKCADDQGIPFTNYGTAIAFMNGILKRSLSVFGNDFGLWHHLLNGNEINADRFRYLSVFAIFDNDVTYWKTLKSSWQNRGKVVWLNRWKIHIRLLYVNFLFY